MTYTVYRGYIMSFKERLKNFDWLSSLQRAVELTVVFAVIDAIIGPQDGLGRILLDAMGYIPREVLMGATGILVVWFGLSTVDEIAEKIPNIPFSLTSLSAIGTVYFCTQYMLDVSILSNGLLGGTVNTIFGVFLGVLVWYISMVAVAGIAMSILGIDARENNQKDIDDPYNDKHAAKILDNE